MGRDLKRVALDFQWPLKKVWEGYLNPHWKKSIKCPHCDGTGDNIESRILYNLAYSHLFYDICKWIPKCKTEGVNKLAIQEMNKHALTNRFFNWAKNVVKSSTLEKLETLRDKVFNSEVELWIAMTPYIDDSEVNTISQLVNQHTYVSPVYSFVEKDYEILMKHGEIPEELFPDKLRYHFNNEKGTWESLDRSSKDNKDWKWTVCEKPQLPPLDLLRKHFLYSAITNSMSVYYVTKDLAEKEGWPVGKCEHCAGEGHTWPSEEVKNDCENWENYEPPTGEGYQLWETTSEGSPTSPVFKTLDELCEYAEKNCTTFGSSKTTKENWKRMLSDNLVLTPLLDEQGNSTGTVFM